MNEDAKNFILNFDKPEYNDYSLAFSCKITKSKITTDRVCIIYQNKSLEFVLNILHMLNDNKKIEQWVRDIFRQGKMIIFSFTGNVRKIYIERIKGIQSNDKFFNRSIEWTLGDEDNFIHRNYKLCKEDPLDYTDLIPPELNQYIDYNMCLRRTDDQIYIRHQKVNGENIPLTHDIGRCLMKMLLNIQKDLDEDKKHENMLLFVSWLKLHERRKAVFNWVQVTEDNMTVYVG